MRSTAFFSILLVAPVLGAGAKLESTSTLNSDAEALRKTRPVEKVVTLLKDMKHNMVKEQDKDKKVYDAIMCWGITNDKDKTKSIADAKDKIADLTTQIEQLTALSAQTATQTADLKKELAEDQESLATATADRKKQQKQFNAEEKDVLGSIASLKNALTILDKKSGGVSGGGYKGQTTGFLQTMTPLESLLQDPRLVGVLTPSARKTVTAFVQGGPQNRAAYSAQGGEIFGILSQMKESFETNLDSSQKEEATNQRAFDDLKAAKEQEIQTGQDQIDVKTQLQADTDEKNAQAKQDNEATKNALASDENFLRMLKDTVATTEDEYQKRAKTRAAELDAVVKALLILDSNEAQAMFSKSLNFMQLGSSTHSESRTQASNVLEAAASKTRSPRLVTLALAVRLDAFGKVKKAIDDMVKELRKEKADEIKQKDFCVEEFTKNDLKTDEKNRDKTDVLADMGDLKGSITVLKGELATLQAEINEMKKQLEEEEANRAKTNQDFEQTVSDQRATQKLLKAALGALNGFYGEKKKEAAAMVETGANSGPPPPAGFGGASDGHNEYKKNDSAAGLLGMLEQIITDSKALEAEAGRDEKASKKAYDDFVKKTNDSIEAKEAEIGNKTNRRSKKEANLVADEKEKSSIINDLDQLGMSKMDLHQSCDFVVKNFEVRQTARDQEVDALKQAKAILSGAKFEAFLQAS